MRKKPKIRYVDMCIYIDQHVYEPDHNIELIFDYLQCLFYALAFKKKFFNKEDDYDKYSLYGATHVYLRLTNERQFLPDDDPRKMKRIKSVLNFIKSILYPLKVNYQKENFNKVYVDEIQGDGLSEEIYNSLVKDIRDSTQGLLSVEVETYLNDIPKTIRSFLKEIPYANDPVMSLNIYISCLLTLLRSMTLSNHNHNRLIDKQRDELKLNAEELAESMLYEEAQNAPIVYHLDSSMKDYISVLTNKIKKIVAKDIRELCGTYEPTDAIIEDILMAPISDMNQDD